MARQDDCDEGGQHVFKQEKETSTCKAILCCPCWALCSCFLSEGTAGASHVGMNAKGDSGGVVCKKCGLTKEEASALSDARQMELNGIRTSKPAGYFSQPAMSPGAPPPSSANVPHHPQTQLAQARPSHEMPTPKIKSRVGTPVTGVRPKSSGGRDAAVHAWLTKVEPEGP